MSLLEIKNLSVTFTTDSGTLNAVRNVDLSVNPGEIVGLVGESGSGKSTIAQAIMKLFSYDDIVNVTGSILFNGDDLIPKSSKEMTRLRGGKIGLIFQDSGSSLNPTMTIGDQIIEGMRKHKKMSKDEAYTRAVELLFNLGINHPVERIEQYPYQLSGGIRQRVMFAIATCCQPELLIADEPTTSLDVTTESQVLQLLKNLDMSLLFISHDLNLISKICDRVYVMYAGQIVESNETENLFSSPLHPYTQALLHSMPSLSINRNAPLEVIQGSPPNPFQTPGGCAFHPRCSAAMKICQKMDPSEDKTLLTPCWRYVTNTASF
jgi:oligopeptide transport system ATP-binding protein